MASKKGSTKKRTTTKKTTGTRTAKKTATKGRGRSSAKAQSGSFLATEIIIWVTLAVSIFLLISNFGIAGFVGETVRNFMLRIIGWMAYIFPFLLFGGISFLVSNRGNAVAYIKTAAGVVLMLLLCILLELIDGRGGLAGATVTDIMTPAVGVAGTYVITIILMVICIVLITERSILGGIRKGSREAYEKTVEDMQRHREEAAARKAERAAKEQEEREQKRMDHQVAGVSFDTTLDKSEENQRELSRKKKNTAGGTTRIPQATSRIRKDVTSVLADASEAAAKHIMEQTGQMPLDGVVINRAMPVSATELTPEPEEEPVQTESTESPAKGQTMEMDPPEFLKEAMAEAGRAVPLRNGPEEKDGKEAARKYRIPPLSLLKKGSGHGGESDAHLRETAQKLQQTLRTFGVNVTVTNISCGPAVTRYELQPEMGVKVSKIVGLADDIKLNLAAADIRIEAPIPGKAAVGIEVPNKENTAVMLRDLLESEEFQKSKSKLSFATGRDIGGNVVISDIAKMPHLLVAGATGSGKSVCINTIIMSILYKAKPDEVKLIMVDPKVVELSVYNGIPHLMIPVVTDPKKAAGALNWAVAEMDKRYRLFAEYNVRDLKGFNERIVKGKLTSGPDAPQKLPQIVIIVDELADLMMVAPGDVEAAICRLAQLARAAGIHLVLATQRPSVNVITGLIKANMPSRIAFSVSSGVDSRTIIDMNGAEKLLGKGDMLFYPAGYQKPVRVQGAFVSDKEVQAVVAYLKEHNGKASYDEEMQNQVETSQPGSGHGAAHDQDERDAYFADAGKFIIEKEKASIGMLQRVFKIGFNRAARIMDQLAQAGVVGEEEGTKPRKILMTMEEFEQYLAGLEQNT